MDEKYFLKASSIPYFFQECFAEYCTEKNIAAFDIDKNGLVWVIAGMNIEFAPTGMPHWKDEITVKVWASEFKKTRIFTDFEMFCGERRFAKGDGCWFILDMNTRRPVPVSVLPETFPENPERVFSERKKIEVNDVSEQIGSTSCEMHLSDLDFNMHVNNNSYIKHMLETFPEKFIAETELSSMSVKFIKESFLHDILRFTTFSTKNGFYTTAQNAAGEKVFEAQTARRTKTNFERADFSDLNIPGRLK